MHLHAWQARQKYCLGNHLHELRTGRGRTKDTIDTLVNRSNSEELYAGPTGNGRGRTRAVELAGHRSTRPRMPKGSTRCSACGA